jgi:hypothetical protein
MQHRQPRLGDIVDDYCPRERRLTNHAVVAMVGSDIKQTRCTTCDTEHEYKHGKVPAVRKKKEATPTLFKQVLASAQPENLRAAAAEEEEVAAPPPSPPAPAVPTPAPVVEEPAREAAAQETEEQADNQPAGPGDDEGPVHRRLIRATLPKPEGGGPVQPRPLPQFTVRQPHKFGNGNARGGRPGGASPSRPRTQTQRGSFGRSGTRETFSARPSGNPHGAHARPAHRGGRPMRQGKKSK